MKPTRSSPGSLLWRRGTGGRHGELGMDDRPRTSVSGYEPAGPKRLRETRRAL